MASAAVVWQERIPTQESVEKTVHTTHHHQQYQPTRPANLAQPTPAVAVLPTHKGDSRLFHIESAAVDDRLQETIVIS